MRGEISETRGGRKPAASSSPSISISSMSFSDDSSIDGTGTDRPSVWLVAGGGPGGVFSGGAALGADTAGNLRGPGDGDVARRYSMSVFGRGGVDLGRKTGCVSGRGVVGPRGRSRRRAVGRGGRGPC